jgi:hypothetical protein
VNGRKRAYMLRRSNNDLTLEQPLFRRAGGPARRSSAWRPKVGRSIRRQIDPPMLTPRTGLGSCRPVKHLTSRFDRKSGRVHWHDAAEPKAPARDLQPWQTDAPLDTSAGRAPRLVAACGRDFEGMRKRVPKKMFKENVRNPRNLQPLILLRPTRPMRASEPRLFAHNQAQAANYAPPVPRLRGRRED